MNKYYFVENDAFLDVFETANKKGFLDCKCFFYTYNNKKYSLLAEINATIEYSDFINFINFVESQNIIIMDDILKITA